MASTMFAARELLQYLERKVGRGNSMVKLVHVHIRRVAWPYMDTSHPWMHWTLRKPTLYGKEVINCALNTRENEEGTTGYM